MPATTERCCAGCTAVLQLHAAAEEDSARHRAPSRPQAPPRATDGRAGHGSATGRAGSRRRPQNSGASSASGQPSRCLIDWRRLPSRQPWAVRAATSSLTTGMSQLPQLWSCCQGAALHGQAVELWVSAEALKKAFSNTCDAMLGASQVPGFRVGLQALQDLTFIDVDGCRSIT